MLRTTYTHGPHCKVRCLVKTVLGTTSTHTPWHTRCIKQSCLQAVEPLQCTWSCTAQHCTAADNTDHVQQHCAGTCLQPYCQYSALQHPRGADTSWLPTTSNSRVCIARMPTGRSSRPLDSHHHSCVSTLCNTTTKGDAHCRTGPCHHTMQHVYASTMAHCPSLPRHTRQAHKHHDGNLKNAG